MSTSPMIPTADLAERLTQVDAAYALARLRLIQARPGNPLGAAHYRTHGITAFSCRAIPSYYMNRIVGIGAGQADLVDDVLSWFDPDAPSPTVELLPTSLSRSLASMLTRRGFAQTGVHATVAVAAAAMASEHTDRAVSVEHVTGPRGMAGFEQAYFAGWGLRPPDPADSNNSIRGWLTQPGWRLYLARCDGVPVGAAVLYLAENVGYLASAATVPAWRGKGVQGALLRHRIRDAAAAGVDVVFGQAEYLSASYRNLLRAGIPLLYNQSLWTRTDQA